MIGLSDSHGHTTHRRARFFVSLAAALAVFATACGGSASSTSGTPSAAGSASTSGTPSAAGSPSASGAYVIGVEADQTGPGAVSGKPMVAAVRAAVDGMNKRGGINGHQVSLVARDDAADTSRAIANVREMTSQFKASAILGINQSAVGSAVAPVLKELQVPLVASNLASTLVTPAQKYVYVYGADFNPQAVAQLGEVKQLSDQGKIPAKPRIAAIHYATPAGQAWIKAVQDNVASITGGTLVDVETFPADVTDLGTQIAKINAAKPDILVPFAASNIMAIIAQAMRSTGVSSDLWIVNYSWASDIDTFKALNLPNYLALRAYKDSGALTGTQGENLLNDAKAAGENPDRLQFVDAYAAALLVMEALKQAGYPAPGSKLISYLDNMNTDLGGIAYGPVKWTPEFHGGATMAGFVRWDGSKLVPVGQPVPLYRKAD